MIFLLNWSDISFLIGRMHPLLVHFPIGILSLAVIMEFGSIFFNKKELGKAALFSLYVGFVATILAGFSGYLISQGGGYSDEMLTPHRWAGISLAVLNILAIVLKTVFREKSWSLKIYLPTLVILLGVVLYTGHLGGTLTHGSDFLNVSQTGQTNQLNVNENFPLSDLPRPEEAYLFNDIVQPILHNHCGSCHNPQKRKGGLDLSTFSSIMDGGDSGPLDVNSISESELLRRLEEPLSSDDRMPPKGKLQLSNIQLELIRWWVAEKYPEDIQLKFMNLPNNIELILNRIDDLNHPVYSNDKLPHVDETVLTSLRRKGYGVNVIADGSPFLEVRFKFKKGETPDEIAEELKPVARHIVWFDLSGTAIKEADFSQFENLTRLNLSQTNIGDSVLKNIASLQNLEYLNLHSTQISSEGIQQLATLSNLKNIYLWNTGILPEEADWLKKRLPETEISLGVTDGS
ncbi:DUF2231 domain-containing protein [Rhodohalobacter sp.]|uniref:DUF2231 domain-containing protein n=1 Tax=Rhodohalobacter sp. TaxID=1974210 RepID=UPI002ACE4AAD|nr:DUF2231 domain-containing protein [Rhodohalobacter sp.]MDZ7757745.1 DUF2231 domain-containing protein [Rhodohalobacter sp.]